MKIVESRHYHVWTDALHARALSHQANNAWDRGTYVRWTVNTAWTVLEIACQDALDDKNISYRFRDNLDEAIKRKFFDPLDWGSGIWQSVLILQEQRKGYLHRFLAEKDLFPEAAFADNAIVIVRAAVESIYRHVGRPYPTWIQDDNDRGWDSGKSSTATLTGIHAGASSDDPNCVHVTFTHNGKEGTAHVLPPGSDYEEYVEDLKAHANVPISRIVVRQGGNILYEEDVQMRGA